MDEDSRTVWCGNLSEKVTEEILYELFLQAGPLEKVRIPKERDGRQRTFGFVTFKHDCSAPYSVALFKGTRLYNKTLILQTRNKTSLDIPQVGKNKGDRHRTQSLPAVKTESSTEISSGPDINLLFQLGNRMFMPGSPLYNIKYPGYVNQFNMISPGGSSLLYASQMSSIHYLGGEQNLVDNSLDKVSKNNRENRGSRNHSYSREGSSRNQQNFIDNTLDKVSKNNHENHGSRNHPYYRGGSSRNNEYNNNNGQNSYYRDNGYQGNGGRRHY